MVWNVKAALPDPSHRQEPTAASYDETFFSMTTNFWHKLVVFLGEETSYVVASPRAALPKKTLLLRGRTTRLELCYKRVRSEVGRKLISSAATKRQLSHQITNRP